MPRLEAIPILGRRISGYTMGLESRDPGKWPMAMARSSNGGQDGVQDDGEIKLE